MRVSGSTGSKILTRLLQVIQHLGEVKFLKMGSRQHLRDIKSGPPLDYQDDIRAYSREYAEALDAQDPLRQFRDEFIIPSKQDLKRKTLAEDQSMYILSYKILDLLRTNILTLLPPQNMMKLLMLHASTSAATPSVFSLAALNGTLSNICEPGQPRVLQVTSCRTKMNCYLHSSMWTLLRPSSWHRLWVLLKRKSR